MQHPEKLRAVCQAGKDSDPGWYRVHRRLSIYLTWALLHTPVTPNGVTLSMMAVGALGALLLAAPTLPLNLAGFGLLYLAFLLDKVDGEIARYRGIASPRAIVLDRTHHLVIEPAILLAAAYREHTATGSVAVLYAGFAAIVLGNVIEEQRHLSPYALLKHLREARRFPSRSGVQAPGLKRAHAWLRPLMAFRLFIVVLPALGLAYVAQQLTGTRFVTAYLFAAAAALVIYLAVQTAAYFTLELEDEIAALAPYVAARGAPPPDPAGGRTPAAIAESNTTTHHDAQPQNGPRKVSGAHHHASHLAAVREIPPHRLRA